ALPLFLLRLLSLTALSKLWSSSQPSSSTRGVNQHQWWLCGWISIPGDGGLYSSVAAGPCLREVGASSAPPSPDFDSGGEGFHSLASPALGVSIFSWVRVCSRFWIGCGSWFMVPVVRGFDLEMVCGFQLYGEDVWEARDEISKMIRWRLSSNTISDETRWCCSRSGDGQVETGGTRWWRSEHVSGLLDARACKQLFGFYRFGPQALLGWASAL
ncbi:LOW QUALITY PROTEIN: hypothetical protein HID58_060813, partial [Brassica napus]